MAFKLPKTYDKWLKIYTFFNPKRWHLTHFVVQNLCKKSWFVQKQAWRLRCVCDWKSKLQQPLLEDHFFTKKYIFLCTKEFIFYEKQSIFYVKNQTKIHIFYIGLRLVSYTLPKIGVKKSIQKTLNISVF